MVLKLSKVTKLAKTKLHRHSTSTETEFHVRYRCTLLESRCCSVQTKPASVNVTFVGQRSRSDACLCRKYIMRKFNTGLGDVNGAEGKRKRSAAIFYTYIHINITPLFRKAVGRAHKPLYRRNYSTIHSHS